MERLDWLLCCCSELPYDKCYLVNDAVEWWRDLDFECRHHVNMKERRLVLLHNLLIFPITPCECDVFYEAVRDV